MQYEKFKQAVLNNWWCKGSPLAWTTENPGIGLAHIAADGDVGHFNLMWLMLQRAEPPPLVVYKQTDMRWVIMQAPQVRVYRLSLMEHAAFKTLDEFNAVILRYSKEPRRVLLDLPGNVPWRTLTNIAQRSLT